MVNRYLLLQAIVVIGLGLAAPADAQNTWTYDHMHLAASDPAQALDWYIKNLGGQPCDDEGVVVAKDKATRVLFGDTMFLFIKSADAQPSSGSTIDSVSFSFPDVAATLKVLQAAGAKDIFPLREIPGLWKHTVIADPWGTKIDLVQDTAQLGFHHVSLSVSDPDASLKWYVATFGGTRGKMKDRFEGIKYGQIWLLALSGAGTTPSAGHSIDHLGFRPTNMDAAVVTLKAQNVKFTMEPRMNPSNGHKIAYVEGPEGVRIELVQH